jgi:N-acetylneuraminate synthase
VPPEVSIGARTIGIGHPTYFIADIGANHDGDLEHARELVRLAAVAGADAAKFQNFTAETIVSDAGFRALDGQLSHQASWAKSPYEVYDDASLDLSWTPVLRDACAEVGIDYFTSAYAPALVDAVDPYVPAFKIGSGDITWLEIVAHTARKGKPVLLAAGASTLAEVERAMAVLEGVTSQIVLMQCNTNYTGAAENISHVNLNVLPAFAGRFPEAVLGFSDHTQGHVAVLGAVALGARVVEKHFTDDNGRVGPDHAFAMTPATWREMVERTRELEAALGDGVKRVEENERETVVLQRRAVRVTRDVAAGETLSAVDVFPLRPCPPAAIGADEIADVVGRTLRHALAEGKAVTWADME